MKRRRGKQTRYMDACRGRAELLTRNATGDERSSLVGVAPGPLHQAPEQTTILEQNMTPHTKILKRWKSMQALADGISAVTNARMPKATVQRWFDRGTIPSKHHNAIMEAGKVFDPPVQPNDFFGI